MIDKILIAIDHSETNKSVFEATVSLAKAAGATLMLLHVLAEEEADYPTLPTFAYYPMLNDRDYELYRERRAKHQQWGLDFLQALTKEARAAGVETEYLQLVGNPGRTICKTASSHAVDLIVVGSRGLKGLKEMFLGSVSNYVTHHAPCSVLIIRSEVADNGERDSLAEEVTTAD